MCKLLIEENKKNNVTCIPKLRLIMRDLECDKRNKCVTNRVAT